MPDNNGTLNSTDDDSDDYYSDHNHYYYNNGDSDGDDGGGSSPAEIYTWLVGGSVLLLVGTVGNLLALAVLSRPKMRRSNASVYLMVVAVTDMAALYTGLLRQVILTATGDDLRHHSEWSCKLHSSLVYFLLDLSAWLLAALSLERFLSVRWPHRVKRYCTRKMSAVVITCISLVLLGLNSHFLFLVGDVTFTVGNHTETVHCVPLSEEIYYFVVSVWPWLDLSVFSLLPLTIHIICNVFIVKSVVSSLRRARRSRGIGAAESEQRSRANQARPSVVSMAKTELSLPSQQSGSIAVGKNLLTLTNHEAGSVSQQPLSNKKTVFMTGQSPGNQQTLSITGKNLANQEAFSIVRQNVVNQETAFTDGQNMIDEIVPVDGQRLTNQETVSTLEQDLTNQETVSTLEQDLTNQETVSTLERELTNQETVSTLERELTNQETVSTLERDLTNQETVSTLERDLTNQETVSTLERDLTNQETVSTLERDLTNQETVSTLERDLTNQETVSTLERDLTNQETVSTLERELTNQETVSTLERDLTNQASPPTVGLAEPEHGLSSKLTEVEGEQSMHKGDWQTAQINSAFVINDLDDGTTNNDAACDITTDVKHDTERLSRQVNEAFVTDDIEEDITRSDVACYITTDVKLDTAQMSGQVNAAFVTDDTDEDDARHDVPCDTLIDVKLDNDASVTNDANTLTNGAESSKTVTSDDTDPSPGTNPVTDICDSSADTDHARRTNDSFPNIEAVFHAQDSRVDTHNSLSPVDEAISNKIIYLQRHRSTSDEDIVSHIVTTVGQELDDDQTEPSETTDLSAGIPYLGNLTHHTQTDIDATFNPPEEIQIPGNSLASSKPRRISFSDQKKTMTVSNAKEDERVTATSALDDSNPATREKLISSVSALPETAYTTARKKNQYASANTLTSKSLQQTSTFKKSLTRAPSKTYKGQGSKPFSHNHGDKGLKYSIKTIGVQSQRSSLQSNEIQGRRLSGQTYKGQRLRKGRESTSSLQSFGDRGSVSSTPGQQTDQKRVSSMTWMLITVSTVFCLTTMPISLYTIINWILVDRGYTSPFSQVAWPILNILMYSNNAINFILYSLSGSRFRAEMADMWRACCKRHTSRHLQHSTSSMTSSSTASSMRSMLGRRWSGSTDVTSCSLEL